MHSYPLHRVSCAGSVQSELILRKRIARCHKDNRPATDRDLQRLKFSLCKIGRVGRNESVYE